MNQLETDTHNYDICMKSCRRVCNSLFSLTKENCDHDANSTVFQVLIETRTNSHIKNLSFGIARKMTKTHDWNAEEIDLLMNQRLNQYKELF